MGHSLNRSSRIQRCPGRAMRTASSPLTIVIALAVVAGVMVPQVAAQCGDWSALDTGIYDGSVNAMLEWNGKIYVGGSFTKLGETGAVTANRIAAWDPATETWSTLGVGTNHDVYALCVWQNALYVGGSFTHAGGTSVNGIAKWNGTAWSGLSGGVGGSIPQVRALAVKGSFLYVGGYFTTAGGAAAKGIAQWTGTTWSEVSGGVTGMTYPNVSAMAVDQYNRLYIAGSFTHAGGVPAYGVARIQSMAAAWVGLGAGLGVQQALSILYVNEYEMYVGGYLDFWAGYHCYGIGMWDGFVWWPLEQGVGGTSRAVSSLALFDEDGDGWRNADLIVGGPFTEAGGVPANRIARWSRTGQGTPSWSPMCEWGMGSNSVSALCVLNDGSSDTLYAGGGFYSACGTWVLRIAKRGPGVSAFIPVMPNPQVEYVGDDATFEVTAEGTSPLEYQWRKDGDPLVDDTRISGSQTATLVIDGVVLSDAGDYDVVVTNGCGSATSNAAMLSVLVLADGDADGDVDLADFARFSACFNGPNRAPAPGCVGDADYDEDGDVDLTDFAMFSACFNGPNRPPAAGCPLAT
ncbi:MAG: immunoglobulin domain-containing protein [Phycisphaerae bacterium]|nr:immunoglobulin domain-containing protein [Phycisphaerae bacterium]